jgi:hypothetical protein
MVFLSYAQGIGTIYEVKLKGLEIVFLRLCGFIVMVFQQNL